MKACAFILSLSVMSFGYCNWGYCQTTGGTNTSKPENPNNTPEITNALKSAIMNSEFGKRNMERRKQAFEGREYASPVDSGRRSPRVIENEEGMLRRSGSGHHPANSRSGSASPVKAKIHSIEREKGSPRMSGDGHHPAKSRSGSASPVKPRIHH
jgi:hypothetical protein